MSPGPWSSAILLPLLLAGFAASDAAAQQPARSCSGTLCDFYYGSPSPDDSDKPAAKPATPTPVMIPNGNILGRVFGGGDAQQPAAPGSPAAPASRPLVGVGGGGLAAMFRGAPAERCTGTFCDFYYGGPPPEKPADQPAAAGTEAQPGAEPAADTPDADEAPPPRRRRVEVEEKPRCASPAADPWKCYR